MKVPQKALVSAVLDKRLRGIGQLLRSARIEKQLTQGEAALITGVCRQTLSRIESGDPSVAWGQVGRYADSMGVAEIFGGASPAAPEAAGRRVRTTTRSI